jgi:hypothetical protein
MIVILASDDEFVDSWGPVARARASAGLELLITLHLTIERMANHHRKVGHTTVAREILQKKIHVARA